MCFKKCMLLVVIVTFITGCITNSQKKSDQFSLQGCAAGGIGAGILAFLVYQGDDDAEDKVAIASMLGCLAGAVAGYHVGKRADHYANAEQAAQEEIALNRSNSANLKRYNQRLKINIEDYKEQIALIQQSNLSYSEKANNLKETKDIMLAQRQKAKDSLKRVNQEIVAARKQYKKYKKQNSASDVRAWQIEIAALRQEKSILAGHVDTLNALDAGI